MSGQNEVTRLGANSAMDSEDTSHQECVLEVRDLTAGYGDLAAIRNVSITLRAGEIVALLGPNGAGKTTTISAIVGDLPRMSGDVVYLGQSVRLPLHKMVQRGVSLVPGERAIFMNQSVLDNLKIAGNVDETLAIFPELKQLLRRRAGMLSGGEQQMLSVGRALAARSRLMLIDELSVGLAPLVVERLLAVVQDVARREGTAVLLVEQQVSRALAVADRWYLLRRGSIVAEGRSDEAGELWESYVG